MVKYFYVVAMAILLISCQNSNNESDVNADNAQNEVLDNLKMENETLSKGDYDMAMDIYSYRVMLEEIEKELSEIDDKSTKVISLTDNIGDDVSLVDDIMMHLHYINASIHNLRLKSNHLNNNLAELKKNEALDRDSIRILKQELQETINNVLAKDSDIAELHENNKLEHPDYDSVVSNYRDQKSYSEVLYSIIHTKFYYVGTKDDLLLKGIVEDVDGVIKISANASDDLFSTINVEKQDVIDFEADDANILSVHPVDSYEFVKAESITGLKVLDYKKFWDKTEFLIVQID